MDLPSNSSVPSTRLFHLVSGSFRSLSLFLLAFDPARRTINHVQTISNLGPHQYVATNQHKDKIFTTTWAQPPSLQSWSLERSNSNPWRISHLNTVPITATSSYIDIPPPFTHIYSVGGPTGEVHLVDEHLGGFGEKMQEILFVPKEELPHADKTRVALRYGSHGIESTSTPAYSLTFVPVLGTDTIEIYSRNLTSGSLTHLSSSHSPRGPGAHDGPRHVKIHPNGKILYCVTEHSNFVDLYEINTNTTFPSLTHVASHSLLPDHLQTSSLQYRGDTLLLTPPTPAHPSPYALFATTRGSTPDMRGWLAIFAIDENGYFSGAGQKGTNNHPTEVVIRHETRTSGGKAHAIDLLTKRKVPSLRSKGPEGNTLMEATFFKATTEDDNDDDDDNDWGTNGDDDDDDFDTRARIRRAPRTAPTTKAQVRYELDTMVDAWQEQDQGVWILLTDDDEKIATPSDMLIPHGGVTVLEWDGWGGRGVHAVAEWPEPTYDLRGLNLGGKEEEDGKAKEDDPEQMLGGSHAIWLD
ncbi:hypothetical protein P691DRAFT_706754 [Macrolepiota fuliginosa MF-IS2]|uniref:Isomerase YbhE n=1 Tax=Macrolepiota fuliginosa MF-IS2 TaxID=1400762 RepID=A0A9P5XCS9_9AGAR|nr:hypothetical protein P691DRAFT_706754 [Macrolepiota fuliginosa MF-IS2]